MGSRNGFVRDLLSFDNMIIKSSRKNIRCEGYERIVEIEKGDTVGFIALVKPISRGVLRKNLRLSRQHSFVKGIDLLALARIKRTKKSQWDFLGC